MAPAVTPDTTMAAISGPDYCLLGLMYILIKNDYIYTVPPYHFSPMLLATQDFENSSSIVDDAPDYGVDLHEVDSAPRMLPTIII